MKVEKTLVIIKPDGINRALVGEIIGRFEKKGLQIAGMKMLHLKDELLEKHYAHLKDKPFFPGIKSFMQASPTIIIALEGLNAINVVRTLAGETHGAKALPGTIRGDLSLSVQSNVVHTSDSEDAAKEELARFFTDDELFSYPRIDFEILYAADERGE
ncbi:nucleoside-diphosphate kinase [Candidatus Woesearchaeota archaeon]|nr:nucleoside-diphosphate kinase [Candidatus Woesearchaeota archaeon]